MRIMTAMPSRMRSLLSGVSKARFPVPQFRCFAVQTGTVKFYVREKGYGFITPDDKPDTDLFVHRTAILTDVPVTTSLKHPYLRQRERVQFEMGSDKGAPVATRVTWIGGGTVPPLRLNYLGGVHERAYRDLGEHCYTILSDASLTSEEQLTKVKDAYALSKNTVTRGEAFVQLLGMKVEDFPVVHSGRSGKYQFEKSRDVSAEGNAEESSVEEELNAEEEAK